MDANTHNNNNNPDDHHPLLLISDRGINNDDKHYLYSITENHFHHLPNAPELDGMNVLGSAYGWIVLAHPKLDNCYMWNPSSMEKIELGLLKYSFVYAKCVMSKPPSEPGYCHVMFYDTDGPTPAQCLLLDGEMVAPPSHQDYDNKDIQVLAAVSFRGKIYCITKEPYFYLMSVDFDGTAVKFTPILKADNEEPPWAFPDTIPYWLWCQEAHLVKSEEEELLMVLKLRTCEYHSNELRFNVFRVEIDRRECTELDSIGDRAIFTSDGGVCFCCSSSSSQIGMYRRNCVYYTIPKNESRCVYVYDLDDRSTTSLLPCPVARRGQTTSNWIEDVFSIQHTISS